MPRDIYAAVNDFLGKNRLLFWALVAFFIAAGFGFSTPQKRFQSIEQRVSGVEAQQAESAKLIRALARAKCIETDRDHWALYDLPCRELLRLER